MIRQPPDVPRKFRMHTGQAIGLVIIAVFPILSLVGIFDSEQSSQSRQGTELRAELQYPTKVPFSSSASIRIKITNVSNALLDTVTVDLDTAYLSSFNQISVVPQPERVFLVRLANIQPGEKREVMVEMMGKEIGSTNGIIEIRSRADQMRMNVETTVFW